jgi:hypothetical protein
MARRPFSGGKGSQHSKAGGPANRNTEYATAGRHKGLLIRFACLPPGIVARH